MHTEKIKIFNDYAKSEGFISWDHINTDFHIGLMNSDEFMIFLFEACDLVQKQQQLKIVENQRKIFYKFFEEGKGNSPELIVAPA